jgi:hypothetical protein
LGFFDPVTLEVKKDRTVQPHILHSGRIHPDGHRLLLYYNGGFDWPEGGIDVYDLKTDVLRTYLAEGELDIWHVGFIPSDLQFTPDGQTMYVLNGGIGLDNGPILEIEIGTKEVTRSWQLGNGRSRTLRLNSKDFAERIGQKSPISAIQ